MMHSLSTKFAQNQSNYVWYHWVFSEIMGMAIVGVRRHL